MHEAGLAGRLIEAATAGLRGTPHGTVRALRVRIGELAGVNADALSFAFECLAADTEFAAARLEFERVPLTIACAACGAVSGVVDLVFYCPRCGSELTRVVTGRELELVAVETDDVEEPAPCTTSM